jgi:hypothetical protein
MPPLPSSSELRQVAEWLGNAYHIACASKTFHKNLGSELIIKNIVFDYRDWTTVGLIVLAVYPTLPFQIIKFLLWTVPISLLVRLMRCLGFGERGVERSRVSLKDPFFFYPSNIFFYLI